MLGRGFSVLEITHEADADAVVVHLGLLDVSAPLLVFPPRAYLDFTVPRVLARANYEMIGEAVAHAAHVSMVVFVGSGIASLDAAVVGHYPFPPLGLEDDRLGKFHRFGDMLEFRKANGNYERLPDAYEIPLQSVGFLDVLHGSLKP